MIIRNALKLDEKDRKILRQLDLDARQSYAKIGKKVCLSIPAVKGRIESLIKKGILSGFFVVINTEKLGYSFFNMYLKTNFSSYTEEEAFIEYLKAHPNVGWFASFNGAWNMKAGIMAKDKEQFNTISREIFNKLGKNLIDRTTTQPLAAYVCKHKFLDSDKFMDGGLYHITSPASLDQQDLMVLAMLDKDPRIALLDIARSLRLPHSVVQYRLKKLIETGVIQEFRPVIDLAKLGYQWHHVQFRLHNIDDADKKRFIGYLKAHPKVFYILDLIGAFNIVAEFLTENNAEFEMAMRELKKEFPDKIHSYEPLLITKEHKHSYFPGDIIGA